MQNVLDQLKFDTINPMFSLLSHSHVIDLRVPVVRGGNEELGIRREAERSDWHGVALQSVQESSTGHVKYVDDSLSRPNFPNNGVNDFAFFVESWPSQKSQSAEISPFCTRIHHLMLVCTSQRVLNIQMSANQVKNLSILVRPWI